MRADHQLEGIVSKLASSKYRSGRSKTWLKTKCFTESSFLIIGTARDRKTKAALLGRRQFNWLLASAPSPPIAFNAADKTLTVVVDFDQRLITLFAAIGRHGTHFISSFGSCGYMSVWTHGTLPRTPPLSW